MVESSIPRQPTVGKKPRTGFYTSTWDRHARASAWITWNQEDLERLPIAAGRRNPTAEGQRLWLLSARREARLCVIESKSDFEAFAREFGGREPD
jgi:hypothetical protein